MDFLPSLNTLTDWLVAHGSLFIFIAFSLGILILPVPEETLMLLAGGLIKAGKLKFPGIFVGALLGSMTGITMSYLIGRSFGLYIIHKYGRFVGFTEKRLQKAHAWFETYGKWTLFVGYFIPGVRHFTGLTAGATKLHLKKFMIFAYSGALFWVCLFLSLGYFLGHVAVRIFEELEFTSDNLILISAVVLAFFVIYKILKKSRKRKK
jgi:membrane protein DedA with SNARE-associated domain